MRAGRAARVLVGCLAVWIASCNAFDESLLDGGGGPSGPSTRPPPRPTGPDGDDMFEVVDFALKDVLLNQDGEQWREIGFDLDGLDTQPDDYRRECDPPRMTARPEADGVDGIDNSFGHNLFPLVNIVIEGIDAVARMSEQEGLGVVMLRLRGWNGQDDDPRVDVTIAQTVTGVAGNPDGSEPDVTIVDFVAMTGGAPAPLPAWDGNDWFYVRDDAFQLADETRPRIRDDNAYVSNRHLVVTLPDRVEIVFPGPENGVVVKLTDAVAVGRIADDLQTIGPVVVAGRWGVNDLLETAKAVGVCEDDSEFGLLQTQLDIIADIRSTPGSGGAGVDCDAVSTGVTFMGFRGNWGGLTPGQPLPNQCDMAAAGP